MSTDNVSLPRPAALWKGMAEAQRVYTEIVSLGESDGRGQR